MRTTDHRMVMRIGNKLVEGPNAIFRISEGDWLEKDLHITIWDGGYQDISTYWEKYRFVLKYEQRLSAI